MLIIFVEPKKKQRSNKKSVKSAKSQDSDDSGKLKEKNQLSLQ